MTRITSPAPPAPGPSRTVRSVLAFSVIGALVWILSIFLAPMLAARGSSGAAALIYGLFSPTCHQMPERCFTVDGHPLAVCGRCLGVYSGFLAGLLAYPAVRGMRALRLPSARAFILFSLPIAVDGAAGVLGLWKSPIGARFATGFAWGTILPFYFVTGIADLVLSRKNGTRRGPPFGPKEGIESGEAKGIE